jgi:hypothetical protein
MAYTQTDLETIITKIETQLYSGVVEIQFEGRRTKYSTGAEKLEALRYFQGLLNAVISVDTSTPPKSRVTRMYSDRGL